MKQEVYVCEVCGGLFYGTPVIVEIEGYRAKVCPKCARSLRRKQEEKKVKIEDRRVKAPLRREMPRKPPKGVPKPPKRPRVEDIDFVENYGNIIKEARESLGLTIEQVAGALNIKASLLRNIEAGKVYPPPDVAREIEKLLEVKIIERNPARSKEAELELSGPLSSLPSSRITLGEALEIKKKKRRR